MKTWCPIVACMLALAAGTGCVTRSLSAEPLPVDRVECARCRMLISTDRGGGEIVSATEDTRFYYDIGCLAADWAGHQGEARAFVRLADGRWSEADAASFAQPAELRTAMGSGIVAFATAGEARDVDRDRRALTFGEVVRLPGGVK